LPRAAAPATTSSTEKVMCGGTTPRTPGHDASGAASVQYVYVDNFR
jgi:hypothetical protein